MTTEGDEFERIAGELAEADEQLLAELEANERTRETVDMIAELAISALVPVVEATAPGGAPVAKLASTLLVRALERKKP